MNFLFRPRALFCALAFALAASLPFLSTGLSGQNYFFFEVTLSADVPAGAQVFYDTGKGFNEAESAYQPLHNHATPARYRFALPAGALRSLRFDPIDQPGHAVFSDPQVVTKYGSVVRRFALADFRPANQVASAVVSPRGLEMQTTPGGNDPFFLITDSGLRLKPGAGSWIRAAGLPFALVFLAVLGLAALPWARCRRLRAWAERHPGRAIAAGSALTVMLACHPVVFFGKSFVSPDNGVLLLHDQYPTMDLNGANDIEWPQYSDIGAMMWWHLYCPLITRDALWRDHELPLWNRYGMGGLPFWGQGQAMVGDPLGFIPLLAPRSAWSWDVKFLLARWLLCCGLGLTVFALTDELSASLLVAGGVGFISFFLFRLNHPAVFSVCYSPWILVAWIRVGAALGRRQLARGCLLLLLVNFAMMNSGTVKEAYMLMVCVNFGGLLLLLFDPQPFRQRCSKLLWTVAAGLTFLFATAPWWRTFIAALKHSTTNYDVSAVSQLSPTQLLGFFDDLFSSQLLPDERTYMPSLNFLFLLGVLWALAAWRDLSKRRAFFPIVLATLLPLALVYGGVPGSVVARIPFVANINSVDNTFSCSLVIFAAVLAGFGFAAMAKSFRQGSWKGEFVAVVILFGGLGLLFLTAAAHATPSSFFVGYAGCLVLAFLAIPIGLGGAARHRDAALAMAVLIVGAFLLVWRSGEYLHTPFDRYVFNPKQRLDLRPRSPAVRFVDAQMREPSRPIGFGLNLFAGYNEMLHWESILGVEPLRSPDYDELAAALGITRVAHAADATRPEDEATQGAGLDLLNVRYYLASPEAHPPDWPGLRLLRELDFGVYESPTAWPRAFFTDRLWRYANVGQLADQVRNGDRRPFAAIQTAGDGSGLARLGLAADLASRRVVPATAYRLTTNTTSFQVDAPSAGVVVLSENYFPHDFRVTVNGRPSAYFRVNHAFKGVYVDQPGTYRLRFEYRPRSLTFSLQLAALGLLGLAGFVALAIRANPASGQSRAAG